MCQGQCTIREAVLAGIHIALVVSGIIAGTLTAVNKIEQAIGCPFVRRYESSSDVSIGNNNYLCDTTLYFTLMSAAVAFLCVMVNWVAALHKSIRWQKIQFVLTVFGVAVGTIATLLHTSGLVLWCQNLLNQKHSTLMTDWETFSRPKSCLAAAREWDRFKQEEGTSTDNISAAQMFSFVIPAEVFLILSTILWHAASLVTCYVTYRRFEEHRQSYVRPDEDEEDLVPENRPGYTPLTEPTAQPAAANAKANF